MRRLESVVSIIAGVALLALFSAEAAAEIIHVPADQSTIQSGINAARVCGEFYKLRYAYGFAPLTELKSSHCSWTINWR